MRSPSDMKTTALSVYFMMVTAIRAVWAPLSHAITQQPLEANDASCSISSPRSAKSCSGEARDPTVLVPPCAVGRASLPFAVGVEVASWMLTVVTTLELTRGGVAVAGAAEAAWAVPSVGSAVEA